MEAMASALYAFFTVCVCGANGAPMEKPTKADSISLWTHQFSKENTAGKLRMSGNIVKLAN